MFRPYYQRLDVRGLLRGACVLVSAVMYLAAAGGFPLPTPGVRIAKNTDDRPFPCQHHACGCHDADQCWRDCCCLSPRQRIAWAESHHVQLPSDLRRQLVASANPKAIPKLHACCAAHPACRDEAAPLENSVADHEHQPAGDAHADASQASDTVFGNLVRHCRGIDSTWLAGVPVIPVVPAAQWQFELLLVGHLDLARPSLPSVVLPADTPPPRA